jgi:hypothetical protein
LQRIVAPAGGAAALAGAAACIAIGATATLVVADGAGGVVLGGMVTSRPRCVAHPLVVAGETTNVPSLHWATALAGGCVRAAAATCRTESTGKPTLAGARGGTVGTACLAAEARRARVGAAAGGGAGTGGCRRAGAGVATGSGGGAGDAGACAAAGAAASAKASTSPSAPTWAPGPRHEGGAGRMAASGARFVMATP